MCFVNLACVGSQKCESKKKSDQQKNGSKLILIKKSYFFEAVAPQF